MSADSNWEQCHFNPFMKMSYIINFTKVHLHVIQYKGRFNILSHADVKILMSQQTKTFSAMSTQYKKPTTNSMSHFGHINEVCGQ